MVRQIGIVMYVDVECQLDEEFFEEEMDDDLQNFFEKHGPTQCDGTGDVGTWCDGCIYAKNFSIIVEENDG